MVGLLACMAASADAGWTATAAILLAMTLVLLLAAQVLAGVQYLRPSGPPGTVPTHMRRMMERQSRRRSPAAAA